MGLAKKGSRTISVDEVTYRWVVSADSGFMSIIVEHDVGPGQRMEAQVSYRDQPDAGQRTQITPSMVQRAILFALDDGWAPLGTGLPPFRLSDANERLW